MHMMLIFIGVALFLGAIAIAGLLFLAVKSQSPKRVVGGAQPSYPFEVVTFFSQGTSIAGWFIPNQSSHLEPRKPVVILVHGWGSSKSKMLRYAGPLYEAGYAILLYDARGHGESGAFHAPTVKSFRDDVLAAVEYASRREEAEPARIAVLAHSFGGFGGVLALRETRKIRVLVTDSMPARFDTIMKAYLSKTRLKRLPLTYFLLKIGFWRAGIGRKEAAGLDPVPILRNTATPVFLVHSLLDDYVPVSELQYLVSLAPGIRHRYIHTPGHRNSHKDKEFWNDILPFLHLHFRTGSADRNE